MLSVLQPPSRPFATDAHHNRPSTPPPSSSPTQAGPSSSRPQTPATPTPSTSGREWREKVGLGPDIQFVPGKTASVLGSGIEGKYKPINDSDMDISPDAAPSSPTRPNFRAAEEDEAESVAKAPSSPARPALSSSAVSTPSGPSSSASFAKRHLDRDVIQTTWSSLDQTIGRGLLNVGNTCFLNSVLQILLHTPAVLRLLYGHSRCNLNFCMVCSMAVVARAAHNGGRGYSDPKSIYQNFRHFAKGMQRGRQEDAHEFLRLLVDSIQKSCLHQLPKHQRTDHAIAETTWVHKVFGGRTRSRVTCENCGHNSDTFEACLDFSLDLPPRVQSVEGALKAFTAVEHLGGKGKDRYKCEKCKQHVDAKKQFTIHEAPLILTIHLKRFTPMGRKLTLPIDYRETISLKRYVSAGEEGPSYSLYGIVSHAGSGPHHGHYYAHVKSPQGRWHEMNDEDVGIPSREPPLGLRSAYILFYVQDPTARTSAAPSWKSSRRVDSDDEQEEEGPAPPPLSPPLPDIKMGGPDIAAASVREQAKINASSTALQEKIASVTKSRPELLKPAVKAPSKPLVDYSDHDDDEDIGEKVAISEFGEKVEAKSSVVIGPQLPPASKPLLSSGATAIMDKLGMDPLLASVSNDAFYGNSSKKRSSPATPSEDTPTKKKLKPAFRGGFSSVVGVDNLHSTKKDGDERKAGGGIKNSMKPKARPRMLM